MSFYIPVLHYYEHYHSADIGCLINSSITEPPPILVRNSSVYQIIFLSLFKGRK